MKCPFCKDKGWKEHKLASDFKYPVQVIGNVVHEDYGTLRYHTCLNCGRSFRSLQSLVDETDPRIPQMELFVVKRRLNQEEPA